MAIVAFRPTTGYEDVKMVAIARLAAPNIPTIQVDWQRYGPKLAQVALTFGADDVDGVSASDEAPEGRRRAPLEEITPQYPGGRIRATIEDATADGASHGRCALMAAFVIGAVGYLNARPLTWALDRAPERWDVRYDLPSVCARCCTRRVDLGLIPSIEYLQAPDTASCRVWASARAGPSLRWRCSRRVPIARSGRSRSTPARARRWR